MLSQPIERSIAAVISASMQEASQTTLARHQHLEQLASQQIPSADGRTFNLECDLYAAELTTISTSTAPQLAVLGEEYCQAKDETELFMEEHGLPRRPPYRVSLLTLAGWIAAAMSGEAVATAPIYAPAVGWAQAFLIAGLISLGVTGPAMGLGLGIVAARHRLSQFYRLLGILVAAFTTTLLLVVLVCGAHFRETLSASPGLINRPQALAEALWQSLSTGPFDPLVEMGNWGLVAAAAIAATLIAWETFKTFGYVGWRELAAREEIAFEAIHATGEEARSRGSAAMRAQERVMKMKARKAEASRLGLERLNTLDTIVTSSHLRAVAHIQVEAANAKGLLARDPSESSWSPQSEMGLSQAAFDRTAFKSSIERATDLHDALIASRPSAVTKLSELYTAFCISLQRATEQASSGRRDGRGGPLLTGPGGWRM